MNRLPDPCNVPHPGKVPGNQAALTFKCKKNLWYTQPKPPAH